LQAGATIADIPQVRFPRKRWDLFWRASQWTTQYNPVTNMKTLDRQKLNVVNKTRSNMFGWRSQFMAEIITHH
jgi:hypothetical protein